MSALKIIIGEKNYSSWSLRGWLAVHHTGLPYEEIQLPLDTPEFYDRIKTLNPSGTVPALYDGDILVWDSAAIIDYCAALAPEQHWWPQDKAALAFARSIFAEMHSGFSQLRTHAPMNMRGRWQDLNIASGVLADIRRIDTLWSQAREQFGGNGAFLFGNFSAADMMYAPVVSRFVTYGVELSGLSLAYTEAVQNYPAYREWYEAALQEKSIVRADELSEGATCLGPLD